MSVVLGETPKRQPRDSALKAASSTGELAASLPLSITLWVYFDQPPGDSETHTLFWYGDGDSQVNYIVLEATESTGANGIDITARLRGSTNSVSATATELAAGAWMMMTVILAEEDGGSYRVTLYINDSEQDTTMANVGTVTPGAYDRFVLGAASSGGGGFNFGRFHSEHVAIWEPDNGSPLSASDIEELYDQRWASFEYPLETPPLGRLPGIAYWVLAGHWSAGIEAADNQDDRDQGQLWNQANPATGSAKPALQMLDTSKPVVWSAKTPVMRYKTPAQPMAPGPIDHPPIPLASRLQPLFYVFNTTGDIGTFKYSALEVPIYTHPNFVPHGFASGESAQNLGPLVDDETVYLPATDVALLAKRVADGFEFTGFVRGTGSVGDGDYEGYAFVRAIGNGDSFRVKIATDPDVYESRLRGYRGPPIVTPDGHSPFLSSPTYVPLEFHPLDDVPVVIAEPSRPNRPWHTWFNEHGKRLVKDYMDGFWTALKRELDERNLCYPRVLWWDQEDWAIPNEAVRVDGGFPRGTFTLQLADSRAGSDSLMGAAPLSTLDEIWTATKPTATLPGGYADDQVVTSDDNQPFLSWYLGWSIAIGQQAMFEAMMDKAKEVFPLTVWSNYDRFSADNPQFRYQGNMWRMAYNTPPADEAEVHGDYSSPKLYTPNNLDKLTTASDRVQKELGVTWSQVMRNCHKSRIDACINAHASRPLAPWMETGSRRFTEGETPYYDLTDEDVWDVFAYAWKRGVCEFIPFIWEGAIPEEIENPGEYDFGATDDEKKIAHDRMYDVCFRLLNTVHWLPQENHARVCRASRRGW